MLGAGPARRTPGFRWGPRTRSCRATENRDEQTNVRLDCRRLEWRPRQILVRGATGDEPTTPRPTSTMTITRTITPYVDEGPLHHHLRVPPPQAMVARHRRAIRPGRVQRHEIPLSQRRQ